MRQFDRLISFSVFGLALILPSPAEPQLASLASDPVTESVFAGVDGSRPRDFVLLGDRAVFTASHPHFGSRLWTTDGTPEGTELLGDICPGCPTSSAFTVYLGRTSSLFFFMVTERLWVTDGTSDGTVALSPSDGPRLTGDVAILADELFFVASEAAKGRELWVTDGTPGGTRLVEDLVPGAEGSSPHSLVPLRDRVYFRATVDEEQGLWASDGTATGTERIALLPSGLSSELTSELIPAGDHLFFYVRDTATNELTLWSSDGTSGGTRPITQIGAHSGFLLAPIYRPLGDRLFFAKHDSRGEELWSSDGTPGGTVRITDFPEEIPFASPASLFPNALARLGSRVFVVTEPSPGRLELWTTEATRVRMNRLATLQEQDGCFSTAKPRVVATASLLFFEVCSAAGTSLWATTGLPGSTVLLASGLDETHHSGIHQPPGAEQEVFFVDSTPRDGVEIFSTDGTPGVVRQRTRLPGAGPEPRDPFEQFLGFSAAVLGETLLFRATDGGHIGRELWATTPNVETTRLVADLAPESTSSNPQDMIQTPTGTLFLQGSPEGELALWQTDGTPGGAQMRFELSDVGCQDHASMTLRNSGSRAFLLCTVDQLVVLATDGTFAGTQRLPQSERIFLRDTEFVELGGLTYIAGLEGPGLLRTNGTPEGTERLLTSSDLGVFRTSSLTAIDGQLYFIAGRGHVFRSDGTEAGTRRLMDLEIPLAMGFWSLPSGVYFFVDNAPLEGLWRTDGTVEGTDRVVDFEALGVSPRFRREAVIELNGELYFLGLGSGSNGAGLWKTDGTQAGTVLVRGGFGFESWFGSGTSPQLVQMGSFVYWAASDPDHGEELWRSDGTPEGTLLVADLQPGPASSSLGELTATGDRLFFTAIGGAVGQELWVSDGTAGGTRLVHDIAPGLVPSSPQQLTVAGSHLLFSADDDLHGRELWSLPLDETGCVATDRALCLADGRFRVEADWRDFQGNQGRGMAMPLTADTGTFWFFDPANVEVVLKVLDGRPLNEHFWTFYGALSSVEYQLTVTDAQTGVARRYANVPGNLASRADTESFGPNGASLERYVLPREPEGGRGEVVRVDSLVLRGGGCAPSSQRLCLAGGRFALEASWRDFAGNQGVGMVVPLSGDTGYFWFFAETNVEVVAKVLDGTALNDHFWVFYGALSSVEYTLTVTDTQTGAVRNYLNPSGHLASVADTGAF